MRIGAEASPRPPARLICQIRYSKATGVNFHLCCESEGPLRQGSSNLLK